MSGSAPLMQIQNDHGSNPLTDSRVRKSLKTINVHSSTPRTPSFSHFMILGDQVPPMHLFRMYQFNRLKDMAPGLQIVSGVISSLITLRVSLADALADSINV